jgi:hypothetical protein
MDEPKYPAVFTMHTPSGPTDCCVKHARAVENLFRFMGAHVNATKAPDGAQCANCINEAKKGAA